MLRIEDLDVFHGDAQALDSVSLEIEQGAIVAIVGANGAGKTSLIRTIAGMHKPARGRILYKGTDIAGWPVTFAIHVKGMKARRRSIHPSASSVSVAKVPIGGGGEARVGVNQRS